MSVPNEPDFVLLKMGDGAAIEVFTVTCGIQDVTINKTANGEDRFKRDCLKPGEIPNRFSKTTGMQMDVTASGFIDKDQIPLLDAALGLTKNYTLEYYTDDGTDQGALYGSYAAAFKLQSANEAIPRDGTASVELTLASQGAWTWTPAA